MQFRDPLNDQPLDVPRQDVSEAAAQFHETGENPYTGDEEAIAEGRTLYQRWCQACHLPDGTGRIGPSLVDGQWKYERTGTDVGQFEIIYAGGAGAMQAFGQRLSQDEILRVMAFLDTLAAAPDRSDGSAARPTPRPARQGAEQRRTLSLPPAARSAGADPG